MYSQVSIAKIWSGIKIDSMYMYFPSYIPQKKNLITLKGQDKNSSYQYRFESSIQSGLYMNTQGPPWVQLAINSVLIVGVD